MGSAPTSSQWAVVIDANVLIAICARQREKLSQAEAAVKEYASKRWLFYAPGVAVGEVLYVLCRKLLNGYLTPLKYEEAVQNFQDQMTAVLPPPCGDASFIARADEIRNGYGCSRSVDSLYIPLAEELGRSATVRLMTFDQDLEKQAVTNAPSVNVHLLLPTPSP